MASSYMASSSSTSDRCGHSSCPWPRSPPSAPPPPRCAACGSAAGNALSVLLVLAGAVGLWLACTRCRGGARGRRRQAKVPTAAEDAGSFTMLVGYAAGLLRAEEEEEEEDDDGDEQEEEQEDDGAGAGDRGRMRGPQAGRILGAMANAL